MHRGADKAAYYVHRGEDIFNKAAYYVHRGADNTLLMVTHGCLLAIYWPNSTSSNLQNK